MSKIPNGKIGDLVKVTRNNLHAIGIITNIVERPHDTHWGPNAMFRWIYTIKPLGEHPELMLFESGFQIIQEG